MLLCCVGMVWCCDDVIRFEDVHAAPSRTIHVVVEGNVGSSVGFESISGSVVSPVVRKIRTTLPYIPLTSRGQDIQKK